MKLFFAVFICLLISCSAFSQAEQDSSKKPQLIFDFSIGIKTVTSHKYNEGARIKMPPAVAYVSQNIGFGRNYRYFVGVHFGIGSTVGSFFDLKKTFLSVINYGVVLRKGFSVKNKVFIAPFAGWQNAIANSTFNYFIATKSGAKINQNNLIMVGFDVSILMNTLSKSKEYGSSLTGLSFYYQVPLSKTRLTGNPEFFPAGINPFSLGGFTVSLFIRLF